MSEFFFPLLLPSSIYSCMFVDNWDRFLAVAFTSSSFCILRILEPCTETRTFLIVRYFFIAIFFEDKCLSRAQQSWNHRKFFLLLRRLKKTFNMHGARCVIHGDFFLSQIYGADLQASEKAEEETIPVKTEQDGRR